MVLFAGCAVAALTIRLAIAANTYGTNDMRTWAGFARLFHERGAAALYALAQAHILFPRPLVDPTQQPQKPKSVPLSDVQDRVLFEVESVL